MGLAVALVGAGALGGAGINAWSAGQSRKAQKTANAAALAQYIQRQQQALGYLQPYEQAGQSALSPLQALVTGQGYSSDQFANILQNNPAYKFNLEQGQLGLQRMQSALGTTGSGQASKEIANYMSGLASTQYNTAVNNLFSLAQMGQGAATNEANVLMGAANGVAGLEQQRGAINANYYNQLGSALSSPFSAMTTLGTAYGFSNLGVGGSGGGNSLGSATGGTGGSSGGMFANSSANQPYALQVNYPSSRI